jgi:transposase
MGQVSKISGEERLALILESFKNEQSIADLCRRHGISQATFYKWRDKFLEGGRQALVGNGSSAPDARAEAKIHELEQVIGQQAVEIQVLKKTCISADVHRRGCDSTRKRRHPRANLLPDFTAASKQLLSAD